MNSYLILLSFILLTLSSFSQNKIKSIDELINKTEPGWVIVQQWIDSAKNKVEVLPKDSIKAEEALYRTQVTTRSPMGAIIYSTGGLLIDSGWIRILGSGNIKLKRSLPDWNKGKTFNEAGETPSFLLIADDVIGGFYAINGGALGNDAGKIYYLSPDNLKWEALDLTYSGFLNFCFNGDLSEFYKDYRWTNWGKEVLNLPGESAYSFFPYLWTKEGSDISKVSKKESTIEELYNLHLKMRKQLGIK